MTHYLVIRNYKPGDENSCRQIVHEGVMSTVNTSFFTALTREITLQLVVIIAAIMFVFLGLPPSICLLAIPLTVVTIYVAVYIGHAARAYGMMEDIYNIPRNYMSSQYTGFWVAEVYEPLFATNLNPEDRVCIKECDLEHVINSSTVTFNRKIVGTIAIALSKVDTECAWLRRMAVMKKYRCQGIAKALLNEAIDFCQEKGFSNIDLITTECHDVARDLYLRRGFELKQLYHKQLVGNVIQVLMYELTLKLPKTNKSIFNNDFIVTN